MKLGSHDAKTLVDLARKAAAWILRNRWRVMGSAAGYVTRDGSLVGVARKDDALKGLDVVLRAVLTPENTASEDALVRALLANRITVVHRPVTNDHAATLGSVTRVDGETADDARKALLDALLSTPELR